MKAIDRDAKIQSLNVMYKELLDTHGPNSAGVGWASTKGQLDRFEALFNVQWPEGIRYSPTTVLDVGCGYGAMAEWAWRRRRIGAMGYTGIDINDTAIVKAKEMFSEYGRFYTADITSYAELIKPSSYDMVVSSGGLGWWEDPFDLVTAMWHVAENVVGFNWHTKTSNLRPHEAISWAENLMGIKSWTMQHNYHPDDYTMHLFKGEGWGNG